MHGGGNRMYDEEENHYKWCLDNAMFDEMENIDEDTEQTIESFIEKIQRRAESRRLSAMEDDL